MFITDFFSMLTTFFSNLCNNVTFFLVVLGAGMAIGVLDLVLRICANKDIMGEGK